MVARFLLSHFAETHAMLGGWKPAKSQHWKRQKVPRIFFEKLLRQAVPVREKITEIFGL